MKIGFPYTKIHTISYMEFEKKVSIWKKFPVMVCELPTIFFFIRSLLAWRELL